MAALIALDAEADVVGADGPSRRTVVALVGGDGAPAVWAGELLTAFHIRSSGRRRLAAPDDPGRDGPIERDRRGRGVPHEVRVVATCASGSVVDFPGRIAVAGALSAVRLPDVRAPAATTWPRSVSRRRPRERGLPPARAAGARGARGRGGPGGRVTIRCRPAVSPRSRRGGLPMLVGRAVESRAGWRGRGCPTGGLSEVADAESVPTLSASGSSGRLRYASDVSVDGMLHAAIVRSLVPAGRLTSVASRAGEASARRRASRPGGRSRDDRARRQAVRDDPPGPADPRCRRRPPHRRAHRRRPGGDRGCREGGSLARRRRRRADGRNPRHRRVPRRGSAAGPPGPTGQRNRPVRASSPATSRPPSARRSGRFHGEFWSPGGAAGDARDAGLRGPLVRRRTRAVGDDPEPEPRRRRARPSLRPRAVSGPAPCASPRRWLRREEPRQDRAAHCRAGQAGRAPDSDSSSRVRRSSSPRRSTRPASSSTAAWMPPDASRTGWPRSPGAAARTRTGAGGPAGRRARRVRPVPHPGGPRRVDDGLHEPSAGRIVPRPRRQPGDLGWRTTGRRDRTRCRRATRSSSGEPTSSDRAIPSRPANASTTPTGSSASTPRQAGCPTLPGEGRDGPPASPVVPSRHRGRRGDEAHDDPVALRGDRRRARPMGRSRSARASSTWARDFGRSSLGRRQTSLDSRSIASASSSRTPIARRSTRRRARVAGRRPARPRWACRARPAPTARGAPPRCHPAGIGDLVRWSGAPEIVGVGEAINEAPVDPRTGVAASSSHWHQGAVAVADRGRRRDRGRPRRGGGHGGLGWRGRRCRSCRAPERGRSHLRPRPGPLRGTVLRGWPTVRYVAPRLPDPVHRGHPPATRDRGARGAADGAGEPTGLGESVIPGRRPGHRRRRRGGRGRRHRGAADVAAAGPGRPRASRRGTAGASANGRPGRAWGRADTRLGDRGPRSAAAPGHRPHGRRPAVRVVTDPLTSLRDVLADCLGILSVRVPCRVGVCGACTVLLDGLAIRSCLTPVGSSAASRWSPPRVSRRRPGAGRLRRRRRSPVRLLHPGGGPCGPRPDRTGRDGPDDTEIRAGLAGNLCRCGTYARIITPPRLRQPGCRSRMNRCPASVTTGRTRKDEQRRRGARQHPPGQDVDASRPA